MAFSKLKGIPSIQERRPGDMPVPWGYFFDWDTPFHRALEQAAQDEIHVRVGWRCAA
jgi:hypothetical protein